MSADQRQPLKRRLSAFPKGYGESMLAPRYI